jgi:hypothetical protein
MLAAVALAACGCSSGSTSSGSPASSFDVVVSGSLQAEWKSGGDDGSSSSCLSPTSGVAEVVTGPIGGKLYNLGIQQAPFAAGAFAYPVSSTAGAASSAVPFVQMTTPTDAALAWIAGLGVGGNGTVIVTGSGNGPVSVAIDLDLTPHGLDAPVHVKGTAQCASRTG